MQNNWKNSSEIFGIYENFLKNGGQSFRASRKKFKFDMFFQNFPKRIGEIWNIWQIIQSTPSSLSVPPQFQIVSILSMHFEHNTTLLANNANMESLAIQTEE